MYNLCFSQAINNNAIFVEFIYTTDIEREETEQTETLTKQKFIATMTSCVVSQNSLTIVDMLMKDTKKHH